MLAATNGVATAGQRLNDEPQQTSVGPARDGRALRTERLPGASSPAEKSGKAREYNPSLERGITARRWPAIDAARPRVTGWLRNGLTVIFDNTFPA